METEDSRQLAGVVCLEGSIDREMVKRLSAGGLSALQPIAGSSAGVGRETPEQGIKSLQRRGGLKRFSPDPLQDKALKH
jgi:hypothetical protein